MNPLVTKQQLHEAMDVYATFTARLDELAEARSQRAAQDGNPVRCGRGCMGGACCRIPVQVGGADAMRIARRVRRDGRDTPELRAALAERMTLESQHPTVAAYWKLQLPCLFLDGEGACSIYLDRPLPCRMHLAWSEPIHCADADAPSAGKIKLIRTDDFKADNAKRLEKWAVAMYVPTAGPMAGLVLWALQQYDALEARESCTKPSSSPPSPSPEASPSQP